MKEENKHKSYKNYQFRLNDKTFEKLKELKKRSNLSWNLFFYEYLIKKDKIN